MITDDERREVARRLRETGEKLGRSTLLWYHIAKALGVRTATDGKTACGMLADLIEPNPDKIGTCPENVLKASGIDRDALLAMADEMQRDLDECASDHEIVGKLEYQIDRIREALGGGDHQ